VSQYYGSHNLPAAVGATPIVMDAPRAFNLQNWKHMNDAQRVGFMREIAERSGRDPRIRTLAAGILAQASVKQRDYATQAAVLLRWVQTNIQYLNEPDEIIQDPLLTLQYKYGDCDDLAMLLASFYEAIRLDWRFVLSGTAHGKPIRWVEGTALPRGVRFAHIYTAVGWPPFRPPAQQTWKSAEPTVQGAALGWDVTDLQRGKAKLPELGAVGQAASAAAGIVATKIAMTEQRREATNVRRLFDQDLVRTVATAVTIGVVTSVLSQILLDTVRTALGKQPRR
jgi:hypothetical protein